MVRRSSTDPLYYQSQQIVNVYKLLFLNTFFSLLLSGCVTLEKKPLTAGGFQLKGKLAVEEAGTRHSGNFFWQQQGEAFGIDVWGPLGQGRIHLEGNAERLALLDGQGDVVREGARDEIMMDTLGWSMPLDVLTSWVMGEPDARLPTHAVALDADGRLESFEQAGWAIRFGQYRSVMQETIERWLPRRIDAHRADTRIRLIIAEWQLHSPPTGT